MAPGILRRDLVLLWVRAGGHCSRPACQNDLIVDASGSDRVEHLGEMAHRIARSDSGPRGDPDLPPEERDNYENLILLCPTCHALIDKQPDTYDLERLTQWKEQHEATVKRSRRREMPNVTYEELETVSKALLAPPREPVKDFNVVPPREKMKENDLGSESWDLLRIGLLKAKEVGEFVEHVAERDIEFPERLKAGFVDKYQSLRDDGLSGDALFLEMCSFATEGAIDPRHDAARLAVLSYLFEKCEVFES